MRKIVILLSSCIVLLMLGYTGYRSYVVWKQSHGISMAKGYIAKADARNAFLSLQQVLKANPRNIEACRMMATLTEAERLPGALAWRERVLELDPKSFGDRLALAQAAMMQKNYPLATNTLAGVSDSDRNTAAYHNLAGTATLMGGQPAEAEAHFGESIRLDPENPFPQVNLAVVRLHLTNALDMADARISLQRVILTSTNANLRSQARRELIVDAMRFKDFPTALKLSLELAEQTNAVFIDKLLRLDVLRKTQSAEFRPTLASYEAEAATEPAKIADLTTWQRINLSTADAFDWLQRLPPQTKTNLMVEVLAAGCQLELKDWHGLQTAIQQQNWNDSSHPWIDFEYMRHAYLARCLRSENLTESSSTEWAVAVTAATGQKYLSVQKESIKSLFEMAVAWKWDSEAEQILWTVVNQYPEEKWAFPVLRTALINWHRTKSLMQLLGIMYRRNPDDLGIKNDLAAIAMLLKAQEIKPFDLAQEVYDKSPNNSYYASTFAFSLYLQGKHADALKVMQKLSPKDLQAPSIALYYGLILKANGDKAEAKAFLDRASKAQFLPEEQALFDQAKVGL
jgi:tetratricopeptide (TPR) repeat protein